MLLEMLSNLPENTIKELKEHHLEKNEHVINTVIALTDIATDMLRESPEFRKAFARIHEEFLKHPESQTTIEQAINAKKQFGEVLN